MKPLFAITPGTEEYVPDFRSEIIDLSGLNDEELSDNVEFKVLPVIIRMFNNSLGERDGDYLKVVLLYIGSLVEERRVGEFLKIVRVCNVSKEMVPFSRYQSIAQAWR